MIHGLSGFSDGSDHEDPHTPRDDGHHCRRGGFDRDRSDHATQIHNHEGPVGRTLGPSEVEALPKEVDPDDRAAARADRLPSVFASNGVARDSSFRHGHDREERSVGQTGRVLPVRAESRRDPITNIRDQTTYGFEAAHQPAEGLSKGPEQDRKQHFIGPLTDRRCGETETNNPRAWTRLHPCLGGFVFGFLAQPVHRVPFRGRECHRIPRSRRLMRSWPPDGWV